MPFRRIFFLLCYLWANTAVGQTTTPTPKGTPVELLAGAAELVGEKINNENVRKVKKGDNQVTFRQGQTLMFCDSARQYLERNHVHALSNILLLDSDSTTITGDSLFYDGNTRQAKLRGRVVLRDKQKTVTTERLDYNLNTKTAYYFGGGKVQDDSSTLSSEIGYYNTITKVSNFRKNVSYTSRETQLFSDTLTYDANKKIVFFNAKTRIQTRQGSVVTDKGQYNTVMGTSLFKGRTTIRTNDYDISGDYLDYDKVLEKGIAKKNVEFYGKKDNVVILGDLGKYDGIEDRSEVFGNAVMLKPPDIGTDTLFLSADTLIAISQNLDTLANTQPKTDKSKPKNTQPDTLATKLKPNRKIFAYRNVRIFRRDFQAKCDSLVYDLADSTIYFFYDPIIWAKNAQLTAETVRTKMKNGQIDQMFLNEKSFIISVDTVKNFNQTKGRQLTAHFKQNNIKKVEVKGNGESLYYVLERDTLVTGMNYIRCSDMNIMFNDSTKLSEIMFYQQPEAKLVPPHELKAADQKLKDFNWRINEQPQRGEVLGIHASNRYKTGELVGAKLIIDDFFQVFLKETNLIFYKQNTTEKDLKAKFFVQFTPTNKNDLNIELRKQGFERQEFSMPQEAFSNKKIKHSFGLPTYKLSKILVGQADAKGKILWEKLYIYPLQTPKTNSKKTKTPN